jgi:hypothetical protein
VADPTRPQNEGKVFLFKYGKKIFDKLNEAMNPEFADETAMNPFDLWEGANFKLKIRQVEGYRNYDKSEFDKSSPLSRDDEEMEQVWNKSHSLQELLDDKHFKTYDELKVRLNRVLQGGQVSESMTRDEPEEAFPTPARAAPAKELPTAKAAPAPWSDDDDDDMSFFKKLAKD